MLPVRLSCVQCQQRKTRCDKLVPCTACTKTGLQCCVVHRTRLPRGKSAKSRIKSISLDERISRLEDLVRQTASLHGACSTLQLSLIASPNRHQVPLVELEAIATVAAQQSVTLNAPINKVDRTTTTTIILPRISGQHLPKRFLFHKYLTRQSADYLR
jgi:hypothetical protein